MVFDTYSIHGFINQLVVWGPRVPVSHPTKLSIKIDVMNLKLHYVNSLDKWLAKGSVMYSCYLRIGCVALRKQEDTTRVMLRNGANLQWSLSCPYQNIHTY